jgi:hypothetical protein
MSNKRKHTEVCRYLWIEIKLKKKPIGLKTTQKTLRDLCKGEIDEKDEWWLPTLDIKLPTEGDQKLPTEGDHKLPTRL